MPDSGISNSSKPMTGHLIALSGRKRAQTSPAKELKVLAGVPTILYLCPAHPRRVYVERLFRTSRHTRTFQIVSASNIDEARKLIRHSIHLILFDDHFAVDGFGLEGVLEALGELDLVAPGISCPLALFEKMETSHPNSGAEFFDLMLGPQIKAQVEHSIVHFESQMGSQRISDLSKVGLAGDSETIQRYRNRLREMAVSDYTVLLEGETGSGKSAGARWIHEYRRHQLKKLGELEEINMGAIPETLAESMLFGHEKGSFTGATERRIGCFEKAQDGTIFLDEIGDCPLDLQKKLLKVIDERTFTRIGGSRPRRFEAKIICATNRHLDQMVQEGTFREDLYFRISTLKVECPGLAERKEDIPEIVRAMLPLISQRTGVQASYEDLPNGFGQFLMRGPIEGNLRGLQQILIRLLTLAPRDGSGKPLLHLWEQIPELLSVPFANRSRKTPITYTDLMSTPWEPFDASFKGLKGALEDVKARFIRCAMDKFDQDTEKAARALKIPRSTLYGHLRGIR